MKRFEPTVLTGLLIGVVAIGASVIFEGIKLRFLWQPTAALVVLGGTLGAVTVRCGLSGLWSILISTLQLFSKETADEDEAMIARLVWLTRNARREGFRVFEQYANSINDALVTRIPVDLGRGVSADLPTPVALHPNVLVRAERRTRRDDNRQTPN